MKTNKNIILASASPRRKKILENLGLNFKIIPADIEENIGDTFSIELIEKLAFEKADFVKHNYDKKAIIIGSDTVVVLNNKILGKPKDEQDAKQMLRSLSGKTHDVISAIAVIDTYAEKTYVDSVISKVKFRNICDKEIESYVNTKEPMDKAGSYAIQGLASVFVESIEGCYDNIVGISSFKLAQMLKKSGIEILELI